MSITIHYQGTARSERDLSTILDTARGFAEQVGWPSARIEEPNGTLERVVDEEERDYHGRVRGLVLHPSADAEPFALLFGDDLFLQDYCKTQFAGTETHVSVIALLREISPYFDQLEVIDEGEFWESRDLPRLRALFAGFDTTLSNYLAENPNAQAKVRLPSGRIIDVIG